MLRKICTIGNSCEVSIPKEILEKLHLSVGAHVAIKVDEAANSIIIEPATNKSHYKTIDKEFASQVDDFIKLYKPALKALAKCCINFPTP
jgi:antitoxin component of MazEF toxin-antitoxin module